MTGEDVESTVATYHVNETLHEIHRKLYQTHYLLVIMFAIILFSMPSGEVLVAMMAGFSGGMALALHAWYHIDSRRMEVNAGAE